MASALKSPAKAVDISVLASSNYAHVDTKSLNGRTISRFLLNNPNLLDETVQTILALLNKNPHLCPTFDTQKLKELIQGHKYLVINGEALCFGKMRTFPAGISLEYKDKFFSLDLIEKPVLCTQNHALEKRCAEFWIAKKGNQCPQGNHPIGLQPLSVDEELQEHLKNIRDEMRIKELKDKAQELKTSEQAVAVEQMQSQVSTLKNLHRTLQATDPVALGGAATKIIVKVGGKKIVKSTVIALCKASPKALAKLEAKFLIQGSKAVSQKIAKGAAKRIPFVSLFIGVVCAGYRVYEGQWGKAVLELASGGAACIPVYGTAISVALDLGIGAHDVYAANDQVNSHNNAIKNHVNVPEEGVAVEFDISLDGAYEFLSFGPSDEPSQQQVDTAYRQTAKDIHPDSLRGYKVLQDEYESMMKVLNIARDVIYQKRGWVAAAPVENVPETV